MRRRHYSDRERTFYDARRAAAAGKVVVVYYGGTRREIANKFVTRDGELLVETLAGFTKDWNDLRPFDRVTDAMNELSK
jgi:hypothetical protein